jgi:hypothetical protein
MKEGRSPSFKLPPWKGVSHPLPNHPHSYSDTASGRRRGAPLSLTSQCTPAHPASRTARPLQFSAPTRWAEPENRFLRLPLGGRVPRSLTPSGLQRGHLSSETKRRFSMTAIENNNVDATRAFSGHSGSYPAALKKLAHSADEKSGMMSAILLQRLSRVRSAALRSRALSFEKAFSIGLKSGL